MKKLLFIMFACLFAFSINPVFAKAADGIVITGISANKTNFVLNDVVTFTVVGENLPLMKYEANANLSGKRYYNFVMSGTNTTNYGGNPNFAYAQPGSAVGINIIKNTSTEFIFSLKVSSHGVGASDIVLRITPYDVPYTDASAALVKYNLQTGVFSNPKAIPVPPTNLVATGGNEHATLTWDSVSEATKYTLHRSTTVGGPYTEISSNITTSSYTDSGLSNGLTYYYIIRAVNDNGISDNSNEAAATPQVPAPSAPINLTATTSNAQVALTWDHSTNATGYTVLRSTYSGGPYTAVASVTSTTYTNVGLENGKTYYFVVQAINAGGASGYSNESTAILPSLKPVLDIIIAEDKVRVGQEITSNIVLKNTTNIYAEDFTIQYDSAHLEYIGFEEVPGYKVYNSPTDTDGKLRFVVASQGASYGINAEATFLKLKFKAKAVGIAKVDATKARIADTTTEFDLEEANCLEDTVIIENQDVNMSGEYTLLDLAIDAAHFGELGSTVDPTKYVANQVGDDTIRDEDLVFIVAQMLANANYAPNNK